ncbi:MAG: dCMP deaminase family protein [Candidatus Cloacimonetes bacterium]|nr:dCMP deaminase family protein [Candidatus Cloacimonadota bacterium]
MQIDTRPTWQTYFIEMAFLASTRSTCLRRKVGAIIVKNNQIISTGYNGAPKMVTHCAQVGCLRERLNVPSGERHELCRGVHAEQNAIVQAAVYGAAIDGSEMYCTTQPCVICAKLIINAQIKTVFIAESYDDELARELMLEAGVALILIDRETGELTKLH